MKALMALILAVITLMPTAAFADAATDAALGLGAFAVFNQMLSGTGIFGGFWGPAVPAVAVAPPAVVLPPPVTVQRYYYAPAPVYVYPAPVYYVPARPVVLHKHGWCPPGLAKKGRC
jgi:hypothetical protein